MKFHFRRERIVNDGYESPVGDIKPEELSKKLRLATDAVHAVFPRGDPPSLGVLVMVFDVGDPATRGGIAYAATAERSDMVKMLRRFLQRQEKLS